jgi:signal transduction histidine kinase
MSRVPIRVRLTAVFALATIVVLAGAAAFVYVRLRADLDESIDDALHARAAAGSTFVEDPEDAFAERIAAGARSVVLTAQETERARQGEAVSVDRPIEGVDGTARVLARPHRDEVIVVAQSLEDRDETLSGLLRSFALGGAAAVIAASLLGYALATTALRPVERMRRRAEGISLGGGEDERLPLPTAHDEIRRLGETLNEMLGRLRRSFDRERRFVADASHELRTPITVIKTELEGALRTTGAGDPGTRASLVAAVEECDRLAQLADDLLVLARAADGRLPVAPAAQDARAVLEATRERFVARATEHGRAIVVDAPAGLTLYADPLRLRQALGNLVDNGLRHGEGTITISARDGAVEVADEGAGLERLGDRAFERFARGDAARTSDGAGLGLAIVRAIAEAHGGSVTVDGARIRLRLSG